jgi:hypothetical protein
MAMEFLGDVEIKELLALNIEAFREAKNKLANAQVIFLRQAPPGSLQPPSNLPPGSLQALSKVLPGSLQAPSGLPRGSLHSKLSPLQAPARHPSSHPQDSVQPSHFQRHYNLYWLRKSAPIFYTKKLRALTPKIFFPEICWRPCSKS